MIAFVNEPCIQTDDISFVQDSLISRDSVNNFIIDGYTDRSRESIIILEIRYATEITDNLFS